MAVPPTTTAAMTFISRPSPALLGNLIEAHGIEQRDTGERAGEYEDREVTRAGVDAGQARGLGVRAGGVDGAAGGEVPRPQAKHRR